MEQDDLVRCRVFQHRLCHLGGVQLLPVPGVDGPLDHGHADQRLVRRVHGAVGRAEPVVLSAQQGLQRRLGLAHLLPDGLLRDPQQPHVVPGMAADLVALRLHPLHQVLVALDLLSDQKKRGPGAPLRKAVQQALRGLPPGAVVKGDGDPPLRRDRRLPVRPLRRRLTRRAARQHGQQQAAGQQASSSHRALTSSFIRR